MLAEKYKSTDYLDSESPKITGRSVEYCSYILEAAETDRPFRLNGNVRNDGYITNDYLSTIYNYSTITNNYFTFGDIPTITN